MEIGQLIVAGGLYHFGFAAFHLGFWKMFRWPGTLEASGDVNMKVTQILNLCLTLVFVVVGWVSVMHTDAMLTTDLGRTLTAAVALFWAARAAEQIWFFGLRNQTSLVLTIVFVAGSVVYLFPLLPTVAG